MKLIKKKKWAVWFGILLGLTIFGRAMGFFWDVNADGGTQITENIVQSVTLSVYENGTQVTDNVYKLDSTVRLDLTYELPDDEDGAPIYKENATFTYALPPQLQINSVMTGDLVFSESVAGSVGTYTVNTDNTIIFKFNRTIEDYSQVKGNFWIQTKLSQTRITGNAVQLLPFPIAGNASNAITIVIKPAKGDAIAKSGTPLPQKYNANKIEWTVDVNTQLSRLSDAVITDPMLEGQELDLSSIAVYPLAVNINGDLTPGSQAVSTGLYDMTGSDTTKLYLKFNNPVSEAYRVKYTTKITSTEQTKFKNTATLTANGSPVSVSAEVDIQLGQTLEKIGGSYNLTDETINWEIRYNYNEKAISKDNAVLKDYFNISQDLVDDSVIIYKVKISSNGTGTNDGTLTRGTDYTITPLPDTATQAGFQINFVNDIQSAYKIVYKTKSASRVYTAETIINEVTYNGIKKWDDVNTAQQILTKQNGYEIDYANKTVKWSIKINGDNKPMTHLVLTDTFDVGGLKLIEGPTFSPSLSSTEYEITSVGTGNFGKGDGFKIDFKSPINQAYTITYTTKFDLYSLTSGKTFKNTASINWDENTSGKSRTASSQFDPRGEVKNNGLKSGTYDVLKKEITWSVGANYNKRSLPAGTMLIDTLPASQQMVGADPATDVSSVKLYELNYNNTGNPVKGNLITSGYTASLIDSGRKLMVEFTGTVNYAFYVEFKTKFIADDISQNKVSNSAILKTPPDTPVSETLTGIADVKNGGQYVAKSGAVDGSDNTLVNWQLIINANQSKVSGVQIMDTPSTNQVLLPDSFNLYTATINSNGDVAATSTKLIKDTDYTLQVLTDSSGNDSFKLVFLKEINEPYVLQYKSAITAVGTAYVTNEAAFSGTGYKPVNTSTSSKQEVWIGDSGGTGGGIRGALKVTKKNTDSTKTLAGAVFSLQRKEGTGFVAIPGTFTSDADGVIDFPNLRLGKYVLKETKAPAGYVLDTKDRLVTINSSTAVQMTVTNDPYGSLKLIKVDKDDPAKKLKDAEFKLYNSSKVVVQTSKTDANGEIVFKDVKFGDYFYQESAAPYGYDLDNTMQSVKIDSEVQKVLDPVKNTASLGSLKIIKVDAADNAKKLAGAKFELYNSGAFVAGAFTNDSGEIVFDKLRYGTYLLRETIAPAGYEVISEPVTITINSKTQLVQTLKNQTTLGSIKFDKVDSADATKKLAGAKFGLYDSSDTKVYEAVSNANGEVIFTNLKLGSYELKEIEAPAGYEVNGAVRDIKIESKTQQNLAAFPNKLITGSLKFVKVDAADSSKKLAGAKFDLLNPSNNSVVSSAFTNASGEIVFSDLKFGNYKLVEVIAPTGYVLDSTVRDITIDSKTQLVLDPITNKETLGSLKLTKVDYNNVNKKLAGAEFKLTNTSTKAAVTGVTDSDGELEFTNLKLGDYTLVETKAPYGFDLDARVRNIKITSGVQQVLNPITNVETIGSIKLVKVDAAIATKKLEGAVFKLTNTSTKAIITKTTNASGELVFDNLKIGIYTLEETAAPAGYDLDGTPQSITIDSNVQKVLDPIKNQETLGSLKFVKVDAADSAKKLAGAKFKLTQTSNGAEVTGTTNGNGELVFDDLKLGTYTLQETEAPAGYDLDATVHHITISGKTQQVLDPIKNVETLGSLKLVKVDAADTTKKLAGAEFKLTNTSTKAVTTKSTNASGEIVFDELKLGAYTLQETKAPAGYDLDSTVRNITISAKVQQVLPLIKNQETLGSLKLTKVDAADPAKKLAGAQFKLTNTSNGTVVTGTTNASGELVFDDLKLGAYTLQETGAPAGYDLDPRPLDITISSRVQQALDPITNEETLGSLKLMKVDAADSAKKLAGAKFKLTNSGNVIVGTGTTDASGEIEFNNLKLGAYTLQETEAPAGYDLDATVHNITISAKTQQVLPPIKNQETLGSLKVVKVDTSNAARKLAGAEFKLYDSGKSVVATAITNANGEIEFKDLKLGVYTLRETAAPANYYLDSRDRSITIDSKVQKVLTVTNEAIPVWTGSPATNPPVINPTPTPVGTTTPGVISTPGPSATATTGITVTPGPTATPAAPAISSTPVVTPQATTATTIEDIPIDGEIPLGGIPSISEQPAHGTAVVTPDGKWTYTPDPGYTGEDKFTITVTDEDGNEQEVIIEIGVDEVPTGSVTDTPDTAPDQDGLPGNLPKTGEESPLPLYLMGGALIVLGIILARKFNTRDKSE